jgi:hypothetical protein
LASALDGVISFKPWLVQHNFISETKSSGPSLFFVVITSQTFIHEQKLPMITPNYITFQHGVYLI